MNRSVVVTLVLLAVAVSSWLLITRQADQPPPTNAATESGYYLRGATIKGLDDNGRHVYTLVADRIVQAPGEELVALHDVALEYALPDSEPWQLFADAGKIPASGTQIALRGNVTMNEQLMRGMPLTTIRTAALDIDLRSHTAVTGDNVEIVRGNYRLSAVGMQADFQTQTLKLLSQVDGRFLP